MSENLTLERPTAESSVSSFNRTPVNGIITRAIAMLTSPAAEWKKIAGEPGGLREVFVPYGVVMALLPAAAFLVQGLYWNLYTTALMGSLTTTPTFTLYGTTAVQNFAGTLISFLIGGKVMEIFAPKFNAKADWVKSCRILIYSSTPWAVASLTHIVPVLGALVSWLAGFWSLALAYQGYQILLENKPAPAPVVPAA